MALGIGGVTVPSLGRTLEGVIQGIGKATDQQGSTAVGDAIQIFSDLNTSNAKAQSSNASDLAGYPDPVRFLNSALGQSKKPLSEFVSSKDVLVKLADPDFN